MKIRIKSVKEIEQHKLKTIAGELVVAVLFVFFLCLLASCGSDETSNGSIDTSGITSQINGLKVQLEQLTETQGNLQNLVTSDFATCSPTGDDADPLVHKICQIAQAATVEMQVQLQDQIGAFATQLQNQITSANTDLANDQSEIDAANANIATNTSNIAANAAAIAAAQASITSLQTSIVTLTSNISTLQTEMTSADAAIAALQTLTNSINGTLNGTMIAVEVGNENSSAGPAYEYLLRRLDKTQFNGFVMAYGPYQSFGANPITATNNSSSAVFTLTAHGYSVGNIISLSGLTSGKGFLTGDVTGQYTIQAVTANTFTLTLPRNATSAGTFGGSNGLVQLYNGSGMQTLWVSGNASDTAVRQTTSGSKVYNFIIRRISTDSSNNTAEMCYDKTNNAQVFATINAAPAGGSGNIVCK